MNPVYMLYNNIVYNSSSHFNAYDTNVIYADILGIITAVENARIIPLMKKERVATIREITIRNIK